MWFGGKNAFKFVLQLLILSQKQILGVKNVVWRWFGVFWGVSTDPFMGRGYQWLLQHVDLLQYQTLMWRCK